MSYETFEAAIAHVELDECPDPKLRDQAFCRTSLGRGALHVFYFNLDGDQCLLKVVSYEEDDYKLSLGK